MLTEVAVGDRVPSLTPLLPGLAWPEREAAELAGVVFVGHPDPRPLLREAGATPPTPLRRTTPLPARLDQDWPGAHDPAGGRRRPTAPGVLPGWPS
jgi:NADH:ubiquinone oxidoreductase subunit C